MYNAAATVARTAVSVLAQTEGDWEWFLIDDGSTDHSIEIVNAVCSGDSRVRIIRQEHSGHTGVVRNQGLAMLAAPLFAILDADDAWQPEFLATQRRLLLETDAAVVHSAARHLEGEQVFDVAPRYRGPLVCDPPLMMAYLCPRNPIYSSSALYRTRVLQAEPGFSEHPDHFSVADGDFWLRLAPRHRFAYNPRPLLLYGVNPQSISHNPKNFLRNFQGEAIAVAAALERSRDLPPWIARRLRHRLGWIQAAEARLLLDQEPPQRAHARELFRSSLRNGPVTSRYLPFQVLSLIGTAPPYYLHRIARLVQG